MGSQVLDRAALLDRIGGDWNLLREIAGIFVAEAPRMVSDIGKAVAARDSEALFRSAHKLKGSVGNFAAGETFEAALKLERMGAAGDLGGAAEAFADLKKKVGRLSRVLSAFETSRDT